MAWQTDDIFLKLATSNFTSTQDVEVLCSCSVSRENAISLLKKTAKLITDDWVTYKRFQLENILSVSLFLCKNIATETSPIDASVIACIHYISKCFLKKDAVGLAMDLQKGFRNMDLECQDEKALQVHYASFYDFLMFLKNSAKPNISYSLELNIYQESLEILINCGAKFLHIIYSELEKILLKDCAEEHVEAKLQCVLHVMTLAGHVMEKSSVSEKCEDVCVLYIRCLTLLIQYSLTEKTNIQLKSFLEKKLAFCTVVGEYNEIVRCFLTISGILINENIHLSSLKEQILVLKSLTGSGRDSVIKCMCGQLSRLCISLQTCWLGATLRVLSLEEFLVISNLIFMLLQFLSSVLKSENSSNMYGSIALKMGINFLGVGVNTILECSEELIKEYVEVSEVTKMLLIVQRACGKLFLFLEQDFLQLKDIWRVFESRVLKLGSVLQYKKLHNDASSLYRHFCCTVLSFPNPFEYSTKAIVLKAFQGYATCLSDLCEYKNALIALGTAVLLTGESSDGIRKCWVAVKRSSSKENAELQTYSILNILRESKEDLKRICPSAHVKVTEQVKNENLCQALEWELETYVPFSFLMTEAITNVVQAIQLHFPTMPVVHRGTEVLLSILWMKDDLDVEKEFTPLYLKAVSSLEALSKKAVGEKKSSLLLSLGNLHFYHFLSTVTAVRKKLLADVSAMKGKYPSEDEKNVRKGLEDPLDILNRNVVVVYANLNVQQEQELLQYLVLAVTVWISALSLDLNEKSDLPHMKKTLENMENTASFFDLYGYEINALRTWNLYYKMSKYIGDEVFILKGICHVLDSTKYCVKELWDLAEEIVSRLLQSSTKSVKETEALCLYYVTKASYCLASDQDAMLNDGFLCLKKLEGFADKPYPSFLRLMAKKSLLLSKYHLTCPKSFEDEDATAYVLAEYAVNVLASLYESQTSETVSQNTGLHHMMIEASEWMGELILRVRMYRDGFHYLHSSLQLAQVLGLATRCSVIISKLAQLDLLCHQLDCCETKFYGLEAIIYRKQMPQVEFTKSGEKVEKVTQLIDNLTLNDEFDEAKREAEREPDQLFASPALRIIGSPILKKSPLKMPMFLDHKKNCLCLSCSSLVLQNIYLDMTLIEGRLYHLKEENSSALSSFRNGLKLADQLKVFQERVLCGVSNEIFFEVKNYYPFLFENFVVRYVRLHLYRNELLFDLHMEGAMEDLTKLPLVQQLYDFNVHIFFEIMEQKILGRWLRRIDKEAVDTQNEEEYKEYSSPVEISVVRTPSPERVHVSCAPKRMEHEKMLLPRHVSPSVAVNLEHALNKNNENTGSDNPPDGKTTSLSISDIFASSSEDETNSEPSNKITGTFMAPSLPGTSVKATQNNALQSLPPPLGQNLLKQKSTTCGVQKGGASAKGSLEKCSAVTSICIQSSDDDDGDEGESVIAFRRIARMSILPAKHKEVHIDKSSGSDDSVLVLQEETKSGCTSVSSSDSVVVASSCRSKVKCGKKVGNAAQKVRVFDLEKKEEACKSSVFTQEKKSSDSSSSDMACPFFTPTCRSAPSSRTCPRNYGRELTSSKRSAQSVKKGKEVVKSSDSDDSVLVYQKTDSSDFITPDEESQFVTPICRRGSKITLRKKDEPKSSTRPLGLVAGGSESCTRGLRKRVKNNLLK